MRLKSLNRVHYIKEDDTFTPIQLQVIGYDNKPFDLSEAEEIVVKIGISDGMLEQKKLSDGTLTRMEVTGGLEFRLDVDDQLVRGTNFIEVQGTINSKKFKAPSKGYYKLNIEKSMDSIGQAVTKITLDYFMEKVDEKIAELQDKIDYVEETREYFETHLDETVDLAVDNKMTPFVEDVNERLAQISQEVIDLDDIKMNRGELISVTQIDKNKGKIDQTYVTEEFLQQIAGTTPINATPARESITRGQLTKNAVSLDLLDFAEKPNNLFNAKDITRGFTISGTTGELVPNASFAVSDLIYIKPNQNYITKSVGRVALYDQAGTFISSSTTTTFTTPSNAYFARFVVGIGDLSTAQVNEGTELLPYDSHEYTIKFNNKRPVNIVPSPKSISADALKRGVISPEKTTFLIASNNLFNKNDVLFDKSIDFDGNVIDEAGFVLSDFIEVEPNTVYAKTIDVFLRIMLYDRNKNFIKRDSFQQGTETYTIPTGVHYIKISCTLETSQKLMFNVGSTVLPYEKYGFTLKSTTKNPIEIDPNLIPVGTGGDLGEQFIYNDNAAYSAGEEKTIANVSLKSVVDIIEFSSNGILSELQIYYKKGDGTEFLYDLVSNDGSESVPNTFENMQLHGSSIVEFIEFDDRNMKFKVYTKNLNFAHGFRIVTKNNDIVSKDIAVRVVGRQYD